MWAGRKPRLPLLWLSFNSVRVFPLSMHLKRRVKALWQSEHVLLQDPVSIPKQAMFPSSPIYLRSHLAACISVGSLSVMSSMAKTLFWRNSALSSKLILASKQTTGANISRKKDMAATQSAKDDNKESTHVRMRQMAGMAGRGTGRFH